MEVLDAKALVEILKSRIDGELTVRFDNDCLGATGTLDAWEISSGKHTITGWLTLERQNRQLIRLDLDKIDFIKEGDKLLWAKPLKENEDLALDKNGDLTFADHKNAAKAWERTQMTASASNTALIEQFEAARREAQNWYDMYHEVKHDFDVLKRKKEENMSRAINALGDLKKLRTNVTDLDRALIDSYFERCAQVAEECRAPHAANEIRRLIGRAKDEEAEWPDEVL